MLQKILYEPNGQELRVKDAEEGRVVDIVLLDNIVYGATRLEADNVVKQFCKRYELVWKIVNYTAMYGDDVHFKCIIQIPALHPLLKRPDYGRNSRQEHQEYLDRVTKLYKLICREGIIPINISFLGKKFPEEKLGIDRSSLAQILPNIYDSYDSFVINLNFRGISSSATSPEFCKLYDTLKIINKETREHYIDRTMIFREYTEEIGSEEMIIFSIITHYNYFEKFRVVLENLFDYLPELSPSFMGLELLTFYWAENIFEDSSDRAPYLGYDPDNETELILRETRFWSPYDNCSYDVTKYLRHNQGREYVDNDISWATQQGEGDDPEEREERNDPNDMEDEPATLIELTPELFAVAADMEQHTYD